MRCGPKWSGCGRLRAVVMNDPYAKYRDEIRAKGMTATPLRLGIAVGHAGDDLPSPYPKGARGDQLYRDGLELGRLRRAKEAGRAAAPEPPTQQPMTDEEIVRLGIAQGFGTYMGGYPRNVLWFDADPTSLIRAVERHHGIGNGESNEG